MPISVRWPRLPILVLPLLVACASGGPSATTPDAGPDSGIPVDPTPDAGPNPGSPDAAVTPEAAVTLYTEHNKGGASVKVVAGYYTDLGATEQILADNVSSVEVPKGLVLYGFTEKRFGGDVSEPITGPVTLNLSADDNTWSSAIVRPASEPFVQVFEATWYVTGKTYPIGSFPSLGAMNDQIESMKIPAELVVEAYGAANFGSPIPGPFIGAQNMSHVPVPDTYSSLVIRLRDEGEASNPPLSFFEDISYVGGRLLLMPGAYPNLAQLGLVKEPTAWGDRISSIDGPVTHRIWGFQNTQFGGAFLLISAPAPAMPAGWNDSFDSIVIQTATDPELVVFFETPSGLPDDTARRLTYPIVDIAVMNDLNQNGAGDVPPGYQVFGYGWDNYGGRGEHFVNTSATVQRFMSKDSGPKLVNDWDSFQVRSNDEPTVTLTFNGGDSQSYPTGAYPNLQSGRVNAIAGATIPCGVKIEAWTNTSYAGTTWVLMGPIETSTIGTAQGQGQWDSMKITQVADSGCE